MEAPRSEPHPNTVEPSPTCQCGRPSWSTVVDLCLELAAACETLGGQDEDLTEVLAERSRSFYVSVLPHPPRPDDPRRGVSYWRAVWRSRLREVLI
jgi:hypothetical protein